MKNILFIILFLPIRLIAQETIDFKDYAKFKSEMEFLLEGFSEDSLNIHFKKYINEYRISKGKNKIQYDPKLNVVTKDQTDYCAKNGFLTHDQIDNPNKLTFIDRANFYNYENELYGENLCSFGGYLYFYNTRKFTNNFYDILAKNAFESWKNSKGHNSVLLMDNMGNFSVNMSVKNENFYFCYLVGLN